MKKLPNITGLRFLLASLVIVFHIPQFCQNRGFPFFNSAVIFNRGEEAVYMFFSLSGFLIIKQLYTEKLTTNTLNLRQFFLNRIVRIFPLYYLVLSFGFVYYRYLLPSFGFNFESNYNLFQALLLSYTFFSNVFALCHPGGIIEILWSIGIEEQFYLFIAPIIFIIPTKHLLNFLLLFTAIYFAIYFNTSITFLKKYNMLFFYFSFGGFCSILSISKRFRFQKLNVLFLGFFILYFTTPFIKNNLSNIYYHLFSMIIFGFMICSLVENPIKILDNNILNYLGNISFGLYMYHAIIMQFVGLLFLKSNVHLKISNLSSILLFNFLVFIFTILTAHLSYKYFESFFLKYKKINRS